MSAIVRIYLSHTETIRKCKISKPNEFGNRVTIQEADHQMGTNGVIRDQDPS
jgi:hypothetical protein